jgi:hypothetical protein
MPSVVLQGFRSFGKAYCTLCTRTVDAEFTARARSACHRAKLRVRPGQQCPRCSAPPDAAFVMATLVAVQ